VILAAVPVPRHPADAPGALDAGPRPGGLADDPAHDTRTAARAGAALMVAVAILSVLALLPATQDADGRALRALGSLAGAVALALLSPPAARVPFVGTFAATGALALILTGRVVGGTLGELFTALLVPLALYVAYFLPRLAALAHLAVTLAALAVALAAAGEPDAVARSAGIGVLLVGTAMLARMLRRRLRALLEELDRSARRDALTGILNRRGLDERLDEELERCRRSGASVSVLIGDLDGFKSLNDARGHQAGDRALAAVAHVLVSNARRIDAVGRLGGDEFLLVLPDTKAGEAQAQADRLREVVRDELGAAGLALSISFGATAFPADAEDVDELLGVADRALYATKPPARGADRRSDQGARADG
jgi:diguanylate cyclase (GGDEF)-like protein